MAANQQIAGITTIKWDELGVPALITPPRMVTTNTQITGKYCFLKIAMMNPIENNTDEAPIRKGTVGA